jgi:Domain of unknown function (DUF3850)
MKAHFLETVQPFFDDILSGSKPFDLRKNDRDFEVGDILFLSEFSLEFGHTDRWILAKVTYVLSPGIHSSNFGLQDGYVILGIVVLSSGTGY